MTTADSTVRPSRVVRLLQALERAGNRLPDPVTLFALACVLVALASLVFAGTSAEMQQRDGSMQLKTVQSLLSAAGMRWAMESAVTNFTSFAPMGKVLTVMLGIGVAERVGLVAAGLRALVSGVPHWLLASAVVFGGVMSSMAADAGYVVLVPLGAVIFMGAGRHPLAGLAAAFAGVSGGFSANLLVTGLDPMLGGLTQEAARTVDPTYVVHATANWYFMIASTFLLTVLGTFVTTRIVEPMLGTWTPPEGFEQGGGSHEHDARKERPALVAAGVVGLVLAGVIVLLAALPSSPLRDTSDPEASVIAQLTPFFHSIEIMIATLFLVPAIVFGVKTGVIRRDKDVASMLNETMATMGAYIVLAFAAAQFVAWFNWTNLGSVTAVRGAEMLQASGLSGFALLLAFVLVTASVNLLIGSASAKWAFMAPIFVPMLMLTGIAPEAVQASYRVGDSVTNTISPLLPYMPIILVFARKYVPDAGLGTLIAAMLPFSMTFLLGWTVMFLAFLAFGIPLGPGVVAWYAP